MASLLEGEKTSSERGPRGAGVGAGGRGGSDKGQEEGEAKGRSPANSAPHSRSTSPHPSVHLTTASSDGSLDDREGPGGDGEPAFERRATRSSMDSMFSDGDGTEGEMAAGGAVGGGGGPRGRGRRSQVWQSQSKWGAWLGF